VGFSFWGMKNRIAIALVALLLGNLPALPSHAEVCEGNACSITFDFTGEIAQFNVPLGVSSIDFEVIGASGGRGGLGGKVTGTLSNLPDTIYVVVGGAGAIGSQAPGGYNGGGQSGGYRTNEGSGGGASDIRLDLGLDSRIVVAGGGGGAGGFSGAPGGAGGELVAASGQSGQGGGGGGGTQSSGGDPGASNGGSVATAGSFGVGGIGGISANAGGGGGGGGWYGGGGGGSDDDNCCSDGGGGGGGSSYTDSMYVAEPVHEPGVQQGSGSVTLFYTKSLLITEFSGAQVDAQTAEFHLALSLPTALDLAQFDVAGLSCDEQILQEGPSGYQVIATGCSDGAQTLRIAAGALDGTVPQEEVALTIDFDATAPEFAWQPAVINHQAATASIDFSLLDGQLLPEDLLVLGCAIVEIHNQQILLSECADASSSVTVPAFTFTDAWGNSAPIADLTQALSFDFVPPTLTVSEPVIDSATAQHSFELNFSEPSSFDVSRISVAADGDCSFEVEASSSLALVSGNCGFGDVTYTISSGSLRDEAGNLGPGEDLILNVEIPKPIVEQPVIGYPDAPLDASPSAELQPTEPAPAAEISPPAGALPEPLPDAETAPEEESIEPEIQPEPQAEPDPIAEKVVEPDAKPSAPAASLSQPDLLSQGDRPDPVENEISSIPDSESDPEPLPALTAEAAAIVSEPPRISADPIATNEGELNLWLIAAGGAAVAGAGYLVLRLIGR